MNIESERLEGEGGKVDKSDYNYYLLLEGFLFPSEDNLSKKKKK